MISAPTLSADPLYMNGLNPPQRRAVETLNGPVLLLAGAGTGKTRALTARLAHLLHTGTATPGQILAVTFTNKAAAEMRHRVSGLLGGIDVAGWHIGTFHSLAARMLRRHAELVGLRSNFTIIDDNDQMRLMKQVFELQSIDSKTISRTAVLELIDQWKNMGLRPNDLSDSTASKPDHPLSGSQLLGLYRTYQERLRMLNACDFGDLLLHLVTIFRDPANGVLAQYHARFKYILVDEYQDTNAVQYQWLRLLAQANHNICCVGDDDQSIYAWRGADISNILNFEKDFPEAKIIRLEQNYRSTQSILNAANGLIARNTGRLGKNLWTEADTGDKITVSAAADQNDEARQITDEIEAAQHKGVHLDDIAVLVRTTAQMITLEERFNTAGIPYRIVGGTRFYERMEIRDALAYLRLVHQPDDDLAFERIVNTPKRGLGPKTIQDLHIAARNMRMSLFYSTEQLVQTDELKPSARGTLQKFISDVNRWRAVIDTMTPDDLTKMILEESGYVAMWQDDKSIEAAGRVDNLKTLVNEVSNYTTLGGYLEHIALIMDNNQAYDVPRVTLMTLHAAKGLEYHYVFLPGWEEDLFPSKRASENNVSGLEEERRLAYVGLTRARTKAHIFYAIRRQIYGSYNDTVPSRFIDEMPPEYVDDRRKNMQQQWFQKSIQVESATRWGGGRSYSKAAPRVIDAVAVHIPTSSAFKVGQRIFHDKFGYGRVTAINDEKLDIDFEKAGSKKLLENFVRPAEQA